MVGGGHGGHGGGHYGGGGGGGYSDNRIEGCDCDCTYARCFLLLYNCYSLDNSIHCTDCARREESTTKRSNMVSNHDTSICRRNMWLLYLLLLRMETREERRER